MHLIEEQSPCYHGEARGKKNPATINMSLSASIFRISDYTPISESGISFDFSCLDQDVPDYINNGATLRS